MNNQNNQNDQHTPNLMLNKPPTRTRFLPYPSFFDLNWNDQQKLYITRDFYEESAKTGILKPEWSRWAGLHKMHSSCGFCEVFYKAYVLCPLYVPVEEFPNCQNDSRLCCNGEFFILSLLTEKLNRTNHLPPDDRQTIKTASAKILTLINTYIGGKEVKRKKSHKTLI